MSDTTIFILGTGLFIVCATWAAITLYAFSGGWDEKQQPTHEKVTTQDESNRTFEQTVQARP
jgi:hypothetical protein